jgi:hypothetical protein
MVVVAEASAASLVDALSEAGAFPVVECSFADAAATIAQVQPAALLLASRLPVEDQRTCHALIQRIETRGGPYMPVFVCAQDEIAVPNALPVPPGEPLRCLIARLETAIRVRTLHAGVMRRLHATQTEAIRGLPPGLLDQATVLCIGRGPSYPVLTTAIGERVNLIGTFSVETAARFLNARDIDGIVIGDGFGPRIVEALLTVLGEDQRFRDLPIGIFGAAPPAHQRLPNLVHLESDPLLLIQCLIPLVRLQAFDSHLKRTMRSLDSDGVVDAETGLLAGNAFWHDLGQAVRNAEDAGSALSVARFAFEAIDPRASMSWRGGWPTCCDRPCYHPAVTGARSDRRSRSRP